MGTRIQGLLTTITGSACPVRKENITDKDLAVIAGIKPERDGALIRSGRHPNHPPSSEAVEMIGMDLSLPKIMLKPARKCPSSARSCTGIAACLRLTRAPSTCPCRRAICTTRFRAPPTPSTAPCRRRSEIRMLSEPGGPAPDCLTVLPGHGGDRGEMGGGESAVPDDMGSHGYQDHRDPNHIPQGPFAFETHGQHCRIAGSSTLHRSRSVA